MGIYNCEKVVLDTEGFDMVLSCKDFACDECIIKNETIGFFRGF